MLCESVRISWEDIQTQLNDGVASVCNTNQRIAINTGFREITFLLRACQTESHRLVSTHVRINVSDGLFMIVDKQNIDTIQRIKGG